ncbi:hypothetical protein [Bacillus sp. Hm123]|uniref:hypothetical protein n=1 Tax=Bacillus sp. Hm123 TaxID=3450745 RepID=UPI003F42A529
MKKNNVILFSFIILNLLFFLEYHDYVSSYIEIFRDKTYSKLFPLHVIIFLSTTLLQGILSSHLKYILVFKRVKNPLPGCRLSKVLKNDARVSLDQVVERFGQIPTDPKEQNAYWYNKIYKSIEQSIKVDNVHQKFLMTRDMTAICVIILIFSIIHWLFFSGTFTYIFLMCIEYFFISLAATNYGNRFVATVVAEAV